MHQYNIKQAEIPPAFFVQAIDALQWFPVSLSRAPYYRSLCILSIIFSQKRQRRSKVDTPFLDSDKNKRYVLVK